MAKQIVWEKDLKAALGRAKSEGRPVLLDFYNPQWIGCQQLDAVSYPNGKLIDFVEKELVPLQVKSDSEPLATDYNVKWTPNLLVLDSDGREHHRIIGFLPPVELIPSLTLGVGKTHFDHNEFQQAIAAFDRVIGEYSYAGSAPEAVFFRGVALYKSTHQPSHLKDAYNTLQTRYHYSEWARRAYPYWLLP